jgi:hypothetical protein
MSRNERCNSLLRAATAVYREVRRVESRQSRVALQQQGLARHGLRVDMVRVRGECKDASESNGAARTKELGLEKRWSSVLRA